MFLRIERELYPYFLQRHAFSNVCVRGAWARLSVGLLCLWVALATGFSMVFLDSKRPTRIWVRASSSC